VVCEYAPRDTVLLSFRMPFDSRSVTSDVDLINASLRMSMNGTTVGESMLEALCLLLQA